MSQTATMSDYQDMRRKYFMYQKQTLRAQLPDGRWVHLDAVSYTRDRNQRWLGTPEQFRNINEWYHGGQLIAVNRFQDRDEGGHRFTTNLLDTGKGRTVVRNGSPRE